MSPFLFVYYTIFLIFKKEKVSISENSYQHTKQEKPRGQSFQTNQQGFQIELSINVLYGYALCLYEQLLQLVHQQR